MFNYTIVTRITCLKMFWPKILLLNNQIDTSNQINMHQMKQMIDFFKFDFEIHIFFLDSGTLILYLRCFLLSGCLYELT